MQINEKFDILPPKREKEPEKWALPSDVDYFWFVVAKWIEK